MLVYGQGQPMLFIQNENFLSLSLSLSIHDLGSKFLFFSSILYGQSPSGALKVSIVVWNKLFVSCLSKSLFCHWLCLWSNCKRNPFSDFSTCGYLSIYLPVILGPNFSSVLTFVMAKLQEKLVFGDFESSTLVFWKIVDLNRCLLLTLKISQQTLTLTLTLLQIKV